MNSMIILGLFLSVVAGAATMLGGGIAFLMKKPSSKILSVSLGFSAGVMIAVSFLELLPCGIGGVGFLNANVLFFAGIIFIFILDILVPHEYIAERFSCNDPHLMRIGLFTALGIAIHNFPEGFAVFSASMHSLHTGVLIALAIIIHNIPEGISVSVPVFCATHSKRKALYYSFLSGMLEPVGALIAAVVLLPFLSQTLICSVLAFVAGVMVYISFDELLPAAHRYGHEHMVTGGIIAGMIVMAATLVLLG